MIQQIAWQVKLESQMYAEQKQEVFEMYLDKMNKPHLSNEEIEKLRYEVQLLDYQGKGECEDKTKKLQEMYTMLVQDKKIKEYFDLEVKFNIMIADVNKIIGNVVQELLK